MIGIFGGTFNPVHLGHVSIAQEVLDFFKLSSIEFIPCNQPVHRENPEKAFGVSSQQRLDMLQLATQHNQKFHINTLELDRGGFSYMVDTLRQLKGQFDDSLVLILGTDAFNQFNNWKQPQAILELCHIVVCQRPNELLNFELLQNYRTHDPNQLKELTAGCIYSFEVKPVDCSSSEIRHNRIKNKSIEAFLASPVLDYIDSNQLYI